MKQTRPDKKRTEGRSRKGAKKLGGRRQKSDPQHACDKGAKFETKNSGIGQLTNKGRERHPEGGKTDRAESQENKNAKRIPRARAVGCQRAGLNGASLDVACRTPLERTRSRSKAEAAPLSKASLHPQGGAEENDESTADAAETKAAEGSKGSRKENQATAAKGGKRNRQQREEMKGSKSSGKRRKAAAAEGSKQRGESGRRKRKGRTKAAKADDAARRGEEGDRTGRRKDRKDKNKNTYFLPIFSFSRGEWQAGRPGLDRPRHHKTEGRPHPFRNINVKIAEKGVGGGTRIPERARRSPSSEDKENFKHPHIETEGARHPRRQGIGRLDQHRIL